MLAAARAGSAGTTLRFALATAASLLFPFAPHVGADVYEHLNGGQRVWEQPWPQADPALLEREEYELVCQVNGKLRDRVQAPDRRRAPSSSRSCAAPRPTCRSHLDGKEVVEGDSGAGQAREPGGPLDLRCRRPRVASRRGDPASRLRAMPELKPAYLIHGDDHGAVAERRAGLHALALKQGDAGSVEALAGEAATPAGVAQALTALTFADRAAGDRRRRRRAVEAGRGGAAPAARPARDAARHHRRPVRARGGAHEGARRGARGREGGQGPGRRAGHRQAVGAAQVGARAGRRGSGLALDQAAAKALVAQVGERQQRILRELEKLALELEDRVGSQPIRVSAQVIEERTAHSAERRVVRARRRARRWGRPRGDARLPAPAPPGRAPRRARLPDGLARCARRSRSRALAGRGVGRRDASAACGCPRARPSASSRTSPAATRSGCALRSACSPTSSSTRAAGRSCAPGARGVSGLHEDTLALRAIAAITVLSADRGARARAARLFLRAPVLRCSAPRLTAVSMRLTSPRCSVSAACSSPLCTAASRRRKQRLDRRGVATVLQALALGAQDALLL